MTNISHAQRYILHEPNTKYYATKLQLLCLLFVEDIKFLNLLLCDGIENLMVLNNL